MRICVADGEREQHKQLMDNLERRLHANHIVFWLRENYQVGASGSLSKRSVYNHYLSVTKQVTKKPLISPTFFGKLVKRAFTSIKCNRKGPRGHTKQHYTHLQRITMNQDEERAFPTGDEIGLQLPSSPEDGCPGSDQPFMSSPCSAEDESKLFLGSSPSSSMGHVVLGNTFSPSSFGENDEMASYLSCLLPATASGPVPTGVAPTTMYQMAPASPGGTSSRSTSPTAWMFRSNPAATTASPEFDGSQQHTQHEMHGSPSASGCLYCDQCQQQPHQTSALPLVDDASVYIKQEPLTWLPEEMTSSTACAESMYMHPQTQSAPSSVSSSVTSCGDYSLYATPSGLDQLPLYMPESSIGPSSPPAVEIALPLEDDWTAFLMDN